MDAYPHPNLHAYSHVDPNAYPHPDLHAYSHIDPNPYTYTDSYAYAYPHAAPARATRLPHTPRPTVRPPNAFRSMGGSVPL